MHQWPYQKRVLIPVDYRFMAPHYTRLTVARRRPFLTTFNIQWGRAAEPFHWVLLCAHGLCDGYPNSCQLDNDVLSTSNPVFPELLCDGSFADEDHTERSELLG